MSEGDLQISTDVGRPEAFTSVETNLLGLFRDEPLMVAVRRET
jgi:hypothetical protein